MKTFPWAAAAAVLYTSNALAAAGGDCVAKTLRLCEGGPPFLVTVTPCEPDGSGFCVGFYECVGCGG